MKILQVIDSLSIGGAEKMCIQLSNLMFRHGHDVAVLYFIQTEQNFISQLNAGIKVRHIPRQLYNPFFYHRISVLCRSFDIIHVHLRSSAKVMYLASLFLPKKTAIVFHDHLGSLRLFDETSKGIVMRKAIQKFKYVAVYEDLRKFTVEKYKLPLNQTSVISNFTERPQEVKVKVFPFCAGNLSILVIANIKPIKNQLFLIYLAQNLIKNGLNNFKFHLVGKVQDNDYYLKFLMQLEKYNLQLYFSEYSTVNNFSEIDLSINLALMPSLEESGPLVNIEYLLMRVPLLSHKVGDVSSTIAKVLPELVLDHLNAKSWAEHILNLEGVPDLLDQYENIYNQYFTAKVAYKKWEACYASFYH